MSKYTTELRFICEAEAGMVESQGYAKVSDVIAEAVPKIFDFDFPIWDESYRNVLCSKILKHYYTREIGFETYGLWKLKLDTKLNEIMPYFNERYKTVDIEFNPLYDVDYTKTHEGGETGENSKDISESGTITLDRDGSVTTQESGNDTLTKTGTETNKKTGTATDAKSGYDSVLKTGTVTDQKTGTVTEEKSGTDTTTKTGTATDAKSGNDTLTKTGTVADSGQTSGTDAKTGTVNVAGTTSNTGNITDKFSDTPQGALTNVSNGTYLTTADIKDETKSGQSSELTTYNTLDTVAGTNSNTTTHNTTDKTTFNSSNTLTNNLTDTLTHDTEDTTTHNTTETQTNNTTDKTTFNSSSTLTNDLTDLLTHNTTDTTTHGKKTEETVATTDETTHSKTGQESGEFSTTREYVEHIVGKMGNRTYSSVIIEWRSAIINIDLEVIESLSDLFMKLW